LGIDRVIDLTFGRGEAAHHILVELYASVSILHAILLIILHFREM
jgi:hypothetical protein